MHYAGLDDRVNVGIAAYEEALKQHHITYELYMYDGANHAFHNDTAPARYTEPLPNWLGSVAWISLKSM